MTIGDAARSSGDIMFRLHQLESQIRELQTARRLEAAAIGAGGLRVHGGGSIRVHDGGDVSIDDGGNLLIAGGGGITVDGGSVDITIGEGSGLVIAGGAGIALRDGAGMTVESGGRIEVAGRDGVRATEGGSLSARHASGEPAAWMGEFGTPEFNFSGHGVLVRTSPNDNILSAYEGGGVLGFVVGQSDAYITGSETFADVVNLRSLGQVNLRSDQAPPQIRMDHGTTGNAANAFLDSTSGRIQRSTSAAAHKVDITDLVTDPAAVLALRPRTWRDRAEVEHAPDSERWYVGFVADELDEIGLGAFVEYDAEGQPDAIAYDRLAAALIPVVQDLAARVSRLEAEARPRATLVGAPSWTPTSKPKRRAGDLFATADQHLDSPTGGPSASPRGG